MIKGRQPTIKEKQSARECAFAMNYVTKGVHKKNFPNN